MFNISLAIGVLFFVNVFSKDSGWLVSINAFTVLTVAILGIPGIVAIVYINFLRNL
jgi:pro-sigmaK processing inhibitor BofA